MEELEFLDPLSHQASALFCLGDGAGLVAVLEVDETRVLRRASRKP